MLNLSLDIGFSEIEGNRNRATRINSTMDKKINRFVVMCIEQYASSTGSDSKSIYNQLVKRGIINEMIEDYEDMHGMSTIAINEYIDARLKGVKV